MHVEVNTSFYRLKMVDADGKYKYSNTIKIDTKYIDAFSIFPNPSRGQLNISGVEGNGTIKLFTIDGKLIKQVTTTANMKIDISNIAKGTYLLQYIDKNKTQSKLLIKQ
jgi:aspartate 1-decarboxylase